MNCVHLSHEPTPAVQSAPGKGSSGQLCGDGCSIRVSWHGILEKHHFSGSLQLGCCWEPPEGTCCELSGHCDDCTSSSGKPNWRPRIKLIPQIAWGTLPGCQLGWSTTCTSQMWEEGLFQPCSGGDPVTLCHSPGHCQRCSALTLKQPPHFCLFKANLGRCSWFLSKSRACIIPFIIAQAAALKLHHLPPVTLERQRHPPIPSGTAVGS